MSSANPTELNDAIHDPSAIPKGFGRIIRDEAGNVVQVDLASEDRDSSSVNQVMEEPKINLDAREKWVTNLGMPYEGFKSRGNDTLEGKPPLNAHRG